MGRRWKGEYLVKEGYRMAMQMDNVEFEVVGFPWQKLWQVPGKVKLLIWSVMCDALPCKTNLKRRHLEIDEICLVCGFDNETALHILYDCPCAKSCRLLSTVRWKIISSFHDCLTRILTDMHSSSHEEFFMLIWSLWSHKNEVLWQRHFQNPNYVLSHAHAVLYEWKATRNNDSMISKWVIQHQQDKRSWKAPMPGSKWVIQHQQDKRSWKAPMPGLYICTIDVAILPNEAYGISMIIRDCHGHS
ncbi:uncharacterized protein LOC105645130 [Jatropha curcas]|uniref:uncharacterized protein LOC105645130 n=1 Tax=Jatropha curcas TaxID=180498 RepID=UPI001895C129|nr:uncharacterized protein LOC105645130 [Jatropha curcas]